MIKLFILSSGTNAGYHISKTLKEKFKDDFFIIGADINESYLISTVPFLDAFYKVPYSNHKEYYSIILNICKKEKINVLIPIFDEDHKLFYPENKDLLELNILSLGVSQKTLPVYENKTKMTEYLKKHNLPVPEIITTIEEDKNYFIKPIDGCASIGARQSLGKEINILGNRQDFIIQEVCKGPEITLECFYYNGHLSTVARERIATKSGVCVKTRVFYSKELTRIAEKFVKSIETPICFNLQFMHNSQGNPVITDVNLRFAGGMSLSYAAGWDSTSALAEILLNRQEKIFSHFKLNADEQFIVRAYIDIVTKKENK